MNELITRNKRQSYMNTGTSEAETYNLIGDGFTSLSEAKNPTEYSRQYVHEATKRTDVVGFAPSVSYSADVYSEDPVIEKIINITDNESVGTDAQVDIVTVNLFEPGTTEGTYVAYKRKYAVIPANVGDGTDALIYTGTFKAVGDAQKGTFTLSSKTFAPDAAANTGA